MMQTLYMFMSFPSSSMSSILNLVSKNLSLMHHNSILMITMQQTATTIPIAGTGAQSITMPLLTDFFSPPLGSTLPCTVTRSRCSTASRGPTRTHQKSTHSGLCSKPLQLLSIQYVSAYTNQYYQVTSLTPPHTWVGFNVSLHLSGSFTTTFRNQQSPILKSSKSSSKLLHATTQLISILFSTHTQCTIDLIPVSILIYKCF